MSIRFTALGFEFTGPDPVVATRRAGFTALGVNFSTLGLENPGVGLVNPKPGLVTPKAGAEKKGGEPWSWLSSFCYSKYRHWSAKLQIRIFGINNLNFS